MTQSIIAGYTDTSGGRDALALAVVLADLDEDSELTVTNTYMFNPPVEQTAPEGWRKDLKDRATAELRPAREALGARPRTTFVASCGVSATDGLQRLAETLEASTLVVGVSHAHGLGRVRVGSVTEQTLCGSSCAVAVAPVGYAERAPHGVARVAVAFNGSDESWLALRSAAEIAKAAGARLTILGAVEEAAVWYGSYVGPDAAAAGRDVVRGELTAAAGELRGIRDVRVEVLDGTPVKAIVEASAEEDLLVLGSRGFGPVRRVLLGSVSSHLVRHATCPTLVVPRGAAHRPGAEADAVGLEAARV